MEQANEMIDNPLAEPATTLEPFPTDDSQDQITPQKEDNTPISSSERNDARQDDTPARRLAKQLMSLIPSLSLEPTALVGTTCFSDGWLGQDSIGQSGQTVPSQRSYSWRTDRWSVQAVAQRLVDAGASYRYPLGRHFFDRIELRHTNQPLLAPFGHSVALTENLITDPTSARNSIVNPILASPDLRVLVTRAIAGRKQSDDTVWGLRLLALSHNWNGNPPSESRHATRLVGDLLVPPNDVHTRRFRFLFRREERRVVNAYYANANQFARFLRGSPAYGLQPDHLNDYSVIPIREGDYGKHLLYLAMASLDSTVWSQYLGHFYVQYDILPGDGPGVYLREMLHTKSLDVLYPGPKGPVIFVIVDEAGTSEPTAPRELGWGQQVPCLIQAEPAQQAVNMWTRFVELTGNGWTDDAEVEHWNGDDAADDFQDINFGLDTATAFRFLQDNVFTPGTEQSVYTSAAILWQEAVLPTQPCVAEIGPQQYYDNVVVPRGIRRGGLNAARRLNQVVNAPVVEAVPPGPPIAGWVPGLDQQRAGRTAHFLLPNVAGVPAIVRPYTQDYNVMDPDHDNVTYPYWEWELFKVDPLMTLRGCESNFASVRSPTDEDNPGAPVDVTFRSVPVAQNMAATQGLAKLKLPAPDNIARLAVGMSIAMGAGPQFRWDSLLAADQHVQQMGNVILAATCGLMITHSLSPAVWMSLIDPTTRYNQRAGDLAYYENLHSLVLGSGSVCRIRDWRGAAAVRALRLYPWYLRRDSNLHRYFSLPVTYADILVNINKVCKQDIVQNFIADLEWSQIMWQGNRVAGWQQRKRMPFFMEYVLATNTLDVQQGWPGYRISAVGDVLAPREYTAFSNDMGVDRVGYECATGEVTYTPPGNQVYNSYAWAGSWSESIPNCQRVICQVLDPILGRVNGSVSWNAVYPRPVSVVDIGKLTAEADAVLSGDRLDRVGSVKEFFDGGAREITPMGGVPSPDSGRMDNSGIPGLDIIPAR
nr:capsid protein [Totiviridae sp.]